MDRVVAETCNADKGNSAKWQNVSGRVREREGGREREREREREMAHKPQAHSLF
jgi:hypothetical protein